MKPEPLKNKLNDDNGDYSKNYGEHNLYIENYFYKEDIKSAVEWLKDFINNTVIEIEEDNKIKVFPFDSNLRRIVSNKIDEAFEDVIK